MSSVVQELSTSCVCNYQLYIKRIMLERENTYELTDVLLMLFTCCTFVNPQNKG